MEGMHRLNVVLLGATASETPADSMTVYWTGTAAFEGGALRGIDLSPVGGPPKFEYDETGNDREQMKFTLTTKIIGSDLAARVAMIQSFARGTKIENKFISGLVGVNGSYNCDWIVENALVTHNGEGNNPSTLQITLAELKVSA